MYCLTNFTEEPCILGRVDITRNTTSQELGTLEYNSPADLASFKVTGYSRGRAHALQLRLRNESFTLRRFGFILHALCTSVRL